MDSNGNVRIAVQSVSELHQGRDREVRGEQSLLFEPFDQLGHSDLVERGEARIWPLIEVRREHQKLMLEVSAYPFDPHGEKLLQQLGPVARTLLHLI